MIRGVELSDADARRLIHEAIDDTLVVEAAAGTGKTTALVGRIVRVLEAGRADVRQIVAVTFTEKAAGELKLRLRRGLEEARHVASAEAAARLDDAVQHLEEAHVSTIHGFCADLLRERAVEASIDPLFRVLTEGQAEHLYDEAFDGWFQSVIGEPPEGVRRALRRPSRAFRPGETDQDGPTERLRGAGYELTQWRDFRGAWTRAPFDRGAAISSLVARVHECADLTAAPASERNTLYADTEPVRRLSRELRRATPGAEDADLDGLETQLIDLCRHADFRRARKGSGVAYGPGVGRARVLEQRDALAEALALFQAQADADLAALLHGELLASVDRYENLKGREGALDFLDLLLLARNLVRDHEPVRRHFQGRFTRLFVDEFQDTDPLQAELLLLLASRDPAETDWRQVDPEPGKLFIVGDPKQSIYRFRRADVAVYRRVCDALIGRGATAVQLRRSFRSTANIQRTVNAAFSRVMDGDSEARQASYVPLEPDRDDHPGQPSVVVLPVPEPYGSRYLSSREIERSLPDAVGAYVDWLVNRSGWSVTEPHARDARVPLQARHICLLFRRFVSYGTDITRAYVEALEARGVKHLLVGGKSFHNRDEIETLRAALTAIEWPDDQLSVFATLRGALFAIGDETLLEYQHLCGRFHPFQVTAGLASGLEDVWDALGVLRTLHRRRNRRPVADTIAALLDHTRAHVGFVLRAGGEQALANVMHVAELARQYELGGGMSFRGFVETLQQAARGGQAAEAPVLEEGSDGVRLMTVHKAKGLEFPVVILADITARLTPWDASRHLDVDRERCALRIGGWSPKDLVDHRDLELRRERTEGERIAYVAATRARDLLVVPALGDAPHSEGWVSPLNAALYPPEAVRREQRQAPGCPAFVSKDSVLRRPDDEPASRGTVCPGAHSLDSALGSHEVVWWSPEPEALTLGVRAPFGLRRDDLIVRDVAPDVLRRGLDTYRAWQEGRTATLETAAQPSIGVRTVTDFSLEPGAGAGVGGGIPVVVAQVPRTGVSPGGARFGSLVHALLAEVPFGPGASVALPQLAQAHGRVLGATSDEIAASCERVAATMKHPVLLRAAAADRTGKCYRETPVTLRLDSREIVEGKVDLAYLDGDEMMVVDFKTDQELDGALERYERQLQIYAAAIGAATGRDVRAILLAV
jgi:ATP-dependent exoDNAse (exonuclease V) beta subunit